jgi:CopA family copper-resistance protein
MTNLTRRHFLQGLAGTALFTTGASLLPSTARANAPAELTGKYFELDIGYLPVNYTGQEKLATAINGSVPAPILRWKEGDTVTLRVKNHLAADSSIHWHGIILPSNMDGVPGFSFAGIKPGEYYDYQFKLNQSGTYWYHSHSGFQEQTGMYGAIIVDPKEPDPVSVDRDYVVILSDWSDEDPEDVYATLKKKPHYYNRNERTLGDLRQDVKEKGLRATLNDREMWNQMRMTDRDISDVTGYTYTFLMNGNTPADGWVGLFNKGERVRLRFINAAAMTLFDVRIPGLKMTVVASDGQNIEPVSVDDFRIGVAETYDVVVEPESDSAYSVFAQAIDRSGYARGTLTPDISMTAEVPEMDPAPILGHGDMGMSHGAHTGMDHSGHQGMDHATHKKIDHSSHQGHSMHAGMDHSMHHSIQQGHNMHAGHKMHKEALKIGAGPAGYGSASAIIHAETEFGPHIDMRADMPMYRLDDPGIGLRDHQKKYGRRVLTYADIRNLYPTPDPREPGREIELHLTGNMARYMWSVNGIKFADAEPLILHYGERVRITLVNDTMMNHPIHLHGMWSDLETGDPEHIPRKHTVIVQPGAKLSYLVTADALGRWAFHCHLLYHMLGMFREVRVVK